MSFIKSIININRHVKRLENIDYRLSVLESISSDRKRDRMLPEVSRSSVDGLLTFLGASLALILAGLVDEVSINGLDSSYDFFAYILPSVAAIVAAMGLFWRGSEVRLFWASSAILVAGYLFYLASKNISGVFFVISISLLAISFLMLLIRDEYWRRGSRVTWVDKVARFILPLALVALAFMAIYFIYFDLHRNREITECTIILDKPATINISKDAKNGMTNHLGGLSSRESFIFRSSVSITVSPCEYKIKAN